MAPAGHAIRGWRRDVKAAAERAMQGRRPASGAVKLGLVFKYRRPQRLCQQRSKVVLGDGERYEDELLVPHIQDPDWDNIGKAISDSLKGVAWVDDCQVFDAHVIKLFADARETPGVWISVWRA